MKTKRGLTYFRPLDKCVLPAPAGWCSWYVFWQGIREEHVVQNTDWLAANLKKFGCQYVQIDDGWQGVGQGAGENRDWYVTEPKKFPHGMKWLADYIRSKGLVPGIWLIPFATSDGNLFRRQPELFFRRADGTSVFETTDPKSGKTEINWTGRYAIDPTSPKARAWLVDLFRMLCDDWGYDYVKIDGQGGSAGVCQEFRNRMADPRVRPDDAYRLGLAAIKAVMGPKRFLLNCGGQFTSCGYCEGIRIGGDVGPDWTGMQPAIQATMQHLYTNNLCFWTDPDVVCVRPPLTLDQARLWATLVGITGQLLMASDDMPKLPNERVEILRRIFPVADIRPMDLYPLPGKPRIFDLRVSAPEAGQWDVVGVFNWDTLDSVSVRLAPNELGWPDGKYVFYDVWEKRLLGVGSDGLTLALAPTSCKLVAARPLAGHPQLIGASRHITQGADDLIEARWDPAATSWSGRSRVVAGDPYELRFTLPPGWTCPGGEAKQEGPLAVLTLRSESNQAMQWRIAFARAAAAEAKPVVRSAKVSAAGTTATIAWDAEQAIAARVYRNGVLLGQTGGTSLADHVRTKGTYQYEVAAVTWEGQSPRVPAGRFDAEPLPRGTAKDARLEDLAPLTEQQDYGSLAALPQRRRQAAPHRRQGVRPRPGHPRQQPDPLHGREPLPAVRGPSRRRRREGGGRHGRVSGFCRRPQSLRQRRDAGPRAGPDSLDRPGRRGRAAARGDRRRRRDQLRPRRLGRRAADWKSLTRPITAARARRAAIRGSRRARRAASPSGNRPPWPSRCRRTSADSGRRAGTRCSRPAP